MATTTVITFKKATQNQPPFDPQCSSQFGLIDAYKVAATQGLSCKLCLTPVNSSSSSSSSSSEGG